MNVQHKSQYLLLVYFMKSIKFKEPLMQDYLVGF